MHQIAEAIEDAIRAVTSGKEEVEWSTDHFIIHSGDTSSTSAITVTSAVSGGAGTDISGAGATTFMDCDTGNGTVTAKNMGRLRTAVCATTTERDAITDPENGDEVYCTDTGLKYDYLAGSWNARDTGTTTANASATVAGKVEMATSAESKAGTDTGGTGAKTVVAPSDIASNVQNSVYSFAADAEASDTYVITLTPAISAYATGQRFIFTANTANTGAATLNVNAIGAKAIVKGDSTALVTGDIAAGQVVEVVYDGTNMVMTSLPNALVAAGDAGAEHYHAIKIGSDNWAVTGAAQTETVAHGLGRVPKLLTVWWGGENAFSDLGDAVSGMFMYDGSTTAVCQNIGSGAGQGQWETGAIGGPRVMTDGTVAYTFSVTTMDATNFVFTSANYAASKQIAYSWRVE
jgi:hypothetical protein